MNISDKVICVDDNWNKCFMDARTVFNTLPIKGRIYVIREVAAAKNGEIGIKLVGITSDEDKAVFYSSRFRKLDELKNRETVIISNKIGANVKRVDTIQKLW